MHPLLHSPFLQALGYAIINSLWQFAFLWLLYFSINTIFKLSSHHKYTTGLVLEIAGFTWFLVTLAFYYNQSLLLAQTAVSDYRVTLPALLSSSGTSLRQQFFLLVLRSERFFPYLSIAYLALLFILAARWIYAYRYSQKVRFAGLKVIEPAWQLFVQRLSSQLGIKRPVNIFLSELVQTPLTVGFFKPLILVPLATVNYLNTQQMEAVILHELAHIKRYDYLFNLLLALIEACLFFNPFMQLIHQQIKKERENCCDDWVLKYEYCAASYARALLQIASNQNHSPLLALKATENKQLLISRIKRIIEKKERNFFSHRHQLLALLVLTTVFSALSFFSPTKRFTKTSASRPANLVFEPMAAKVKNPLFNPVFFLANSAKEVSRQPEKTGEIKLVKGNAGVNHSIEPSAPPRPAAPPDAAIPFDQDENNLAVESGSFNALTNELTPVTIANEFNTSFEMKTKDVEKRATRAQLEKKILAEASKQNELAEKHSRRFQNEALKEKEVIFNFEKIRPQLRSALDQIKTAKNTVELVKLHNLIRTGIRKIEKERLVISLTNTDVLKMNELELLEKHLEWKIDSINTQKLFTLSSNPDLTFTVQMPAVVYTFSSKEKDHNFSYQYSPKPAVRVISHSTSTDCPNSQKKRKAKIAILENDDDDLMIQEESVPAPPAPVRRKAVYIIKI